MSDFARLKEAIILEQFLRGIHPEVKSYLGEKDVKNVSKAATLAENFCLINPGKLKNKSFQKSQVPKSSPPSHNLSSSSFGDMGKSPTSGSNNPSGHSGPKSTIKCFNCNEVGHIAPKCLKPKGFKKSSYATTQDKSNKGKK